MGIGRCIKLSVLLYATLVSSTIVTPKDTFAGIIELKNLKALVKVLTLVLLYRIRRNIGESNIWRNSAKYVSADLILANITCIHTHTFARILLVD